MALTSFGAGFVTGFATGFVAREAFPVVREIMKPVTVVTTKAAVHVFERSREAFLRAGEVLEDVVAEVRAELVRARKGKPAGRRKAKLAVVS
jgi:hypothetical protein